MSDRLKKDQLNLGQVEDVAKKNYFSLFPEAQLHSILDAFIINKPMTGKVGGDGFWVQQAHDSLYISVFDCMGHGHLASMMTRIYTNSLKKVVIDDGIIEPGKILEKLHHEIREKFEGKKNLQVGTGADVGIVRIGTQVMEMEYAGAKMELLQVTNGELNIIKPDRMQIGEMFDFPHDYKTIPMDVSSLMGSKFYLSSDGLKDLFGGPSSKKLGKEKVKELLESNYMNHMAKQKEEIAAFLEDWSGSNMQLDDLLLIGFSLG